MKRTATLLAIAGLALSINPENFQDNEEFAPIIARAGIWAATHPQQIAKGVEVGIKAAPAVIGGAKTGINWVKNHVHFDEENDDNFIALEEDDELFAPIVARAGIWAATHPQQIAKGVEAGIKAAPTVIAGAKTGINWVKNHIHHDDENDDHELFAPVVARAGIWAATHPQQIAKGIEVGVRAAPTVVAGAKKGYDWVKNHVHRDDENDDQYLALEEDNELFAPIIARAGVWAMTHPQQIAKGIEVGARAAPAVIGGAKKGYNWVKNHVHRDDENDDQYLALEEDNELFAPVVARAGIWAATHPQQIAKGIEVGVKAAPTVIAGAKKGYDWVKNHVHRDDEDNELFAQEQVKPKTNGQNLRRGHVHVEKSDLELLKDLLMEQKKIRGGPHRGEH